MEGAHVHPKGMFDLKLAVFTFPYMYNVHVGLTEIADLKILVRELSY